MIQGIGNEFGRGRQSEYVLGQWNKEEQLVIRERVALCCEAVIDFGLMGIGHAMNSFNTK